MFPFFGKTAPQGAVFLRPKLITFSACEMTRKKAYWLYPEVIRHKRGALQAKTPHTDRGGRADAFTPRQHVGTPLFFTEQGVFISVFTPLEDRRTENCYNITYSPSKRAKGEQDD